MSQALTHLSFSNSLFSPLGPSGEEVLYGTSDGKIGLIQLGRQVKNLLEYTLEVL